MTLAAQTEVNYQATTKRDMMLRYARQGIGVFPLAVNSKVAPAGSHGHLDATTDTSAIRRWIEANPDMNWGARGGAERLNPKTREVERLAWIDLDKKGEKDGLAYLIKALQALGIKLGEHPTLTIQTPSGGLHLGYWFPAPGPRHGAEVLGPGSGVDIRTELGYVVGPGSTIGGRPYIIIDDYPIASAGRLAEVFPTASPAPAAKGSREPLDGVDAVRAVDRARDYLRTAPAALEGQGGDSLTYQTACAVKDMGCTQAQALALMDECWNPRCMPPWDDDQLAAKVAHAWKYGKDAPGSSAPEAVFPKVEAPADGGAEPKGNPFEEMNKEYAFVLANGNKPILHETFDGQGKPLVDFLSVQTFHEWHANRPFQSGDARPKAISKCWMEWSGRRQYARVGFIPGGEVSGDVFNLWRGYAVTEAPGSWPLMRAHIRNVICGGDPELDRYVMGWLALMLQRPGTRAGTALVLRGDKGAGKGTLGDWLLRIFGRHGIHVSHARHLTGNFNAHLREAAFLFCDEAFFAGDKQHESVLKALITERDLVIESKGVDAVAQRNCLHVLMASNSDWVVPATANERRYCVMDVSDARMGDFDYFDALERERDSGGLAAMLHDLLAYDLAKFRVWDIPGTKALLDQKRNSLTGADGWLAEAISEERIYGQDWGDAELAIAQDDAYASYEAWAKKRKEWTPQKSSTFWQRVRKILPTIRDARPTVNGERVRKVIFPPLPIAGPALERFLRGREDAPPSVDIFS